jgi:hypothetical protein
MKKNKDNQAKTQYLRASSKGSNMTYKELKRQAVVLGMPFSDVCGAGIFELIAYINKSKNEPDPHKIDEFDEWITKHFDEIGIPQNDVIRSSRLRLGFIGDELDPDTGEVIKKVRRIPGLRKPREKKSKREMDENGHVKGTKKQYTWELTQKGYDLDRIIRRVSKKFPDANEKSINLWYRSAKRNLKKKNGI